jgi:hypothetical protein
MYEYILVINVLQSTKQGNSIGMTLHMSKQIHKSSQMISRLRNIGNCDKTRTSWSRRQYTSLPEPTTIYKTIPKPSLSQWLCVLRRVSAAARLLALRIRIPPGWYLTLVRVVYFHLEVSAKGWSFGCMLLSSVVCLIKRDREASLMRRPWPARGCRAMEEKEYRKQT